MLVLGSYKYARSFQINSGVFPGFPGGKKIPVDFYGFQEFHELIKCKN